MKRSRRSWSAIGVIAAAGVVLSACSGGNPGQSETPATDGGAPEVEEFIASTYQNPVGGPLFTAIEEGYFADRGLNVTPVFQENGPAGNAQLLAGDIQAYHNSYFSVIDGNLAGIPLRIISEVVESSPQAQTIEVLPGSDIDSVGDLAGRRVAVLAINSSIDARIKNSVALDGGDPDAVEFVELPYGEMPAALELGNVDAIAVANVPRAQVKDTLGTREILDFGAGEYAGFAEGGWIVTEEFAKANPNAIAAFQCGIAEGTKRVLADPEAYLDATLKYVEATRADLEALPPLRYVSGTRVDKLQLVADMMERIGMIDKPFDISSIIIPMPESCE